MYVRHSDASCIPDDVVPKRSDDMITNGDNEMDSEEPVHAESEVDQNIVPQMLEEDLTPFEEDNVNRILIEQEMDEAEANAAAWCSFIYGSTCTGVENTST